MVQREPQILFRSREQLLDRIAESRAEVRAVYGGFGLAIAAMLVLVITVAAALGGMAFGRLVSGVVDRPKAFYPNWFYFVVEILGAAALLWTGRG